MRLFALTSLFALATPAFATPPYIFDWNIGAGGRGGQIQWPFARPQWVQVHHHSSDFFVIGLPATSGPVFIPSSSAAIYDVNGILLASLTVPQSQTGTIRFGTQWHAGDIGSSTMLIPDQFYYVGFAPGGTIFRDGFNADFVNSNGLQQFSFSPTPSTTIALALPAMLALRRRR